MFGISRICCQLGSRAPSHFVSMRKPTLRTPQVKLGEASKLFGKKFASGASVVKNATGKEQIDIQGDCLDGCAELIIKLYGKENGIDKKDIYYIDNKQKLAYFDEE